MMRIQKLEHRFVRSVPRELEPGVLYVSMDYGTAVHSCCCGCGEQVVTPFTPTDWKMTYDGESISLTPSVGNWHSACRSHYIIRNGRVLEAVSWSRAQVDAEHQRDKAAKTRFYQVRESVEGKQHNSSISGETTQQVQRPAGFWHSITEWLFGSPPKK